MAEGPALCSRCGRANPAAARYCHHDGHALGPVDPVSARFRAPFRFPGGRACDTLGAFADACQAEWNAARELLVRDGFDAYFASVDRPDLARLAQDARRLADPDAALARFLNQLPVDRADAPKLDLQPRRFALGRIPVGDVREVELTLFNVGNGTLHGSVQVVEGGDWLSLGGAPRVDVAALREQTVTLRIDLASLPAAQNYVGKITVVTSGGVAEAAVRFELLAKPFAKAPLAGATSPRALAERMRDQARDAAPLLEAGDVERWFAANHWPFPIQGPTAKGMAGVQQFFEAMGLSVPPKLALSQRDVRYATRYPDSVRFQVTLQSPTRKWVYAEVVSDRPWLKTLTPLVVGPQQTNLLFEADPKRMDTFPPEPATVEVRGNGGQRLTLTVNVDVRGAPRAPTPWSWRPVWAFALALFAIRVLLLPLADLGLAPEALTTVADRMGLSSETAVAPDAWPWARLVVGFDAGVDLDAFGLDAAPADAPRLGVELRQRLLAQLLRGFVARTAWLFGLAAAAWLYFVRRDGWPNPLPHLVAGAALGLIVSATSACGFYALDLAPRLVVRAFPPSAWPWIAVAAWTLLGAAVGLLAAALRQATSRTQRLQTSSDRESATDEYR